MWGKKKISAEYHFREEDDGKQDPFFLVRSSLLTAE